MSLLSWERGLKFDEKNNEAKTCESLLSWERGLKSVFNCLNCRRCVVAPLVGAWIEIRSRIIDLTSNLSLLSWERGLKFRECLLHGQADWSLLSWERGLKYSSPGKRMRMKLSLLSWERGLKCPAHHATGNVCPGRSSRGSVD